MTEEEERQAVAAKVRNLEELLNKSYWGDSWGNVKNLKENFPNPYDSMSIENLRYTLSSFEEYARLRMHHSHARVKWIMENRKAES